jgi:hypothetical protein
MKYSLTPKNDAMFDGDTPCFAAFNMFGWAERRYNRLCTVVGPVCHTTSESSTIAKCAIMMLEPSSAVNE